MENILVIRLMRLIKPLSFELKLEILAELTNNLKDKSKPKGNEKEILLNELFGSWDETSDDDACSPIVVDPSNIADVGKIRKN